MTDTPINAPNFNSYRVGKSSPAEDGLNTTASIAYDFSNNPCRFFIAQSDGNISFTSYRDSVLTMSVLANIKYPVRLKSINVVTSADLICFW